jgi:hypothetical protein
MRSRWSFGSNADQGGKKMTEFAAKTSGCMGVRDGLQQSKTVNFQANNAVSPMK